MRKIYKSLTKEQKERGVIFSSTLSKATTELAGDTIHEVFHGEPDQERKIRLLLDDSFFSGSIGGVPCPWKYNIVRR